MFNFINFDSIILNNLYFEIKLNLFNDGDVTKDIYKIKGYLKVAVNDTANINSNYANDFTEFFIEPGETEADGTIYIFKANKTSQDTYSYISSYMNEEEFKAEFYNSNNDYTKKYKTYTSQYYAYRPEINLSAGDPLTPELYDTKELAEIAYKQNYLSIYDELDENSVDYKEKLYRKELNYEAGKLSNTYEYGWFEGSKNDAIKKFLEEFFTKNYDDCDFYKEENYKEYFNVDKEVGKLKTYYKVSLIKDIKVAAVWKYEIRCKNEDGIHIDVDNTPFYKYTLTNKYSYNVEMYKLDKKDFIGNMELHIDNNANSSGQVPTLIYYLLDYSQVISKDANVAGIELYDILIGSICDSMQGNNSSTPTINYLNGWKINFTNGFKNGSFIINPKDMISNISTGSNTISFNTGLELSFSELETDIIHFILKQTDNNKYLVSASASSMFSLNIGILDSSYFNFTSTSNETTIKNEMNRYDTFVSNFKTNEYTSGFINSKPNKILIYSDTIARQNVKKYNGVTFNNSSNYKGLLYDYRYFEGM